MMTIDVFAPTGQKTGSLELPSALFSARINPGLMHLALVRQQSNRRHPIAHAKHRGEMTGSTRKMYAQKHTGRARRGAVRSPLLRGGGKSFGPRNDANFRKDMPQKMRRAALCSCLSLRAKEGAIVGLESYPDEVKTKSCLALLRKLPVTLGRKIVVVLPAHHRGLELSARNIAGVKTLLVNYLNPEDVLGARNIIFLVDAVTKAEEIFGKKTMRKGREEIEEIEEKEEIEEREGREEPQRGMLPAEASKKARATEGTPNHSLRSGSGQATKETKEVRTSKITKPTKQETVVTQKKMTRSAKAKKSSDSSESSVSSVSSPKKK